MCWYMFDITKEFCSCCINENGNFHLFKCWQVCDKSELCVTFQMMIEMICLQKLGSNKTGITFEHN